MLEGDVDKAWRRPTRSWSWSTPPTWCATPPWSRSTPRFRFADGAWHVYAGTQSTSFARMTLTGYLSKVLNKKPEDLKIYVHQYLVGGGFGGKQDYDEILAAAYCAKEVGRPVKLIQTRESQFRHQLPAHADLSPAQGRTEERPARRDEPRHRVRLDGPALRRGQEVQNGTDWLQLDSWTRKKQDIDQWSIGGSDHWYYVKTTACAPGTATARPGRCRRARCAPCPTRTTCSWSSRSWTRWRTRWSAIRSSSASSMLNGKGGNRGIPNTGYPPGTPSDYYMDRLWISLPWPNDKTWPPYESGHRRRRAAARATACAWRPARPAGVEATAAQHRHGHRRILRRGAAEPDLGSRHRRGHSRSEHRDVPASTGSPSRWILGLAVNPINVKAQVQGAALWGASQVLSERLT